MEDPRITRVDALDAWVMTYAVCGPLSSRVALAISDDLVAWRRLGPVSSAYDAALGTDLNLSTNKDALLFPEPVPGPDGQACFALLHRATWHLDWLHPDAGTPVPRGVADARPGTWVSFVPADRAVHDPAELTRWSGHRFVVARPPTPVLEPEAHEERVGIVPNVVVPTAIDVREDHSADVYYGMADDQIGAARLRW